MNNLPTAICTFPHCQHNCLVLCTDVWIATTMPLGVSCLTHSPVNPMQLGQATDLSTPLYTRFIYRWCCAEGDGDINACCSVLFCSVPCRVVLCFSVLRCVVLCCFVLYYAVLYCTVLCCVVLYFVVWCGVVCRAELGCILLCCAVLPCCAMLCHAVQSSGVQC